MAQKSKPKNGHSFADDLRPGEEVLWMSSSVQTTIWRELIAIGKLFAGILLLALLGSVFALGISRLSIDTLVMAYVNMLACLTIAAFPLMVTRLVRWWLGARRPSAYASLVTNERLISLSQHDQISLPLEDIPFVSLSLRTTTQGVLHFGDDFPMWTDVQNAVSVKFLIETAQERRRQALAALEEMDSTTDAAARLAMSADPQQALPSQAQPARSRR